MARFVEFSLERLWRLTVIRSDSRTEILVPGGRLAAMVANLAADDVLDMRCEPYYGAGYPRVGRG
ncbi:hypothetical protein Val02_90230 [Virgisporangium aliadipatigenens]|uniref:Uncharacterized protein n=1 Tax=Virgisporangium aliadipatigenens TaxID=741659 RepID=A0A8J4DXI7_9ACTN|nr:hypothetical protein [Virgisporangium aliadipatigenens]GIJ52137.1 hypothetical protein Val02_90230 [Virgisporangium aliadipatigenens]